MLCEPCSQNYGHLQYNSNSHKILVCYGKVETTVEIRRSFGVNPVRGGNNTVCLPDRLDNSAEPVIKSCRYDVAAVRCHGNRITTSISISSSKVRSVSVRALNPSRTRRSTPSSQPHATYLPAHSRRHVVDSTARSISCAESYQSLNTAIDLAITALTM